MSERDALTRAGGAGLIEVRAEHGPTGGVEDAGQRSLHPEVVDFARWFADWWLRRGRLLFADEQEEHDAA